jgi:hypothetical protein
LSLSIRLHLHFKRYENGPLSSISWHGNLTKQLKPKPKQAWSTMNT